MILMVSFGLYGQETIQVRDMVLQGNKKTKDFVLLRELDIAPGTEMRVAELQKILRRNKDHLLNTGLFVSAKITLPNWHPEEKQADVLVEVHETWYLLPLPVFKLADRNINVWWSEYNRDFSRVIWGVRLSHKNLTGRRDDLKVVARVGFSHRFQFRYRFPYLNKKNTLGFETEIGYSRSKNGPFNTEENQLTFLTDGLKTNFKSFGLSFSIIYRPQLYQSHKAGIIFRTSAISDTVLILNPSYFSHGSRRQRYIGLNYEFTYDRRNRRHQATSGYLLNFYVLQMGLDIFDDVHYGVIRANIKKFIPIHPKISTRISISGRWFFNRNIIPYNHSQALGYANQYVRGYEKYVIDGTDYVLSHHGILWEFFNQTFDLSGVLPFRKVNVVPIRLFLSANLDVGYVNTPLNSDQNSLDGQWLYGYGPSFEILLAETYLIGVDYSFNHLGESGVFFHTKFNF